MMTPEAQVDRFAIVVREEYSEEEYSFLEKFCETVVSNEPDGRREELVLE